jgi:hypothetical protein
LRGTGLGPVGSPRVRHRRLRTGAHPFSLLSSISGLVLGRDENDYFRTTGMEVRFSTSFTPQRRWEARVFTERHAPLRARATTSLRGLVDRDFAVRDNLEAERVQQWGATLLARREWGEDPTAMHVRGEVELHGETGDYDFLRPLVRLRGDRPLGSSTRLALSAVAGVGLGELPIQRRWQIGGARTVRGHDPAALRGESVFLLRGEISRGSPARSLSLFGDLGWAGDREELSGARPLQGFGLGFSSFGESLRIELAQGMKADGVRLYFRYGAGR